MKFGLAIISNLNQDKTNLITKLSNELEIAFKYRKYGNDVKAFTIGIVCVEPQFEQFFKPKKAKYTKGKKEINPDGFPFLLEDDLEYDVKIDFETFKNATEQECRRILAKEILNSLSVFESMKKKIKDFDLKIFKDDLECYFKEKKMI